MPRSTNEGGQDSDTPTEAPPAPAAPRQAGPDWRTRVDAPEVQRYLEPLAPAGKRNLAWIGSFLLAAGVFLPIEAASIPFLGSVSDNLWNVSSFQSGVIIVLALVSAGVAAARDYGWLWATGALALLILVGEFFNMLTESYMHPSWGWFVLLPGALFILAAAALTRDPNEPPGDALAAIDAAWRRLAKRGEGDG